MMLASTLSLGNMVANLSTEARRQGLSDSAWARLAGLPKESLSRLRGRKSCDWSTLDKLASALGQQLGISAAGSGAVTQDGHLPLALTRHDEDRLQRLVLLGDAEPAVWRAQGPAFFMAGLAVLMACCPGVDRPRMLALAEILYPGMSEPVVFNLWLQRAPLEPSRFLSQLESGREHATRS